jgi:phospholipase C
MEFSEFSSRRVRPRLRFVFLPVLYASLLMGSGLGQVPSSKHVVLVVEENHGYDSATAKMQSLGKLAKQYATATNYYGDHHPSIGNYFVMTTGWAKSTDDHFTGTIAEENIVSQIASAKKSWKVYAEGLPSAGYVGDDVKNNHYVKRHVPMAYFDVIRNDKTQAGNLVPFEQFSQDLRTGLPDFSLVIPDLCHDAHGMFLGCPDSLETADQWLQDNVIAPLLKNEGFLQDGILIVTFDEAETSDKNHGGGHILTVVAGPKVKPNYKGNVLYQHESLFVTLEKALGLPRLEVVKGTTDMADLFQ